MKFTLYRADRLGMPENCIYPHKVEVTDKNTLLQAVSYDYDCKNSSMPKVRKVLCRTSGTFPQGQ